MAAMGLIGVIGAGLLTGCGGYQITADSTCQQYLQLPGEERHDAAQRISAEIKGVDSPGNPMWGLSLDGPVAATPP
jgi:hypothetical protein